jgi:hypothetical protein
VLYFSVCNFDASKGGLYKSTDRGSTWAKVGELDEPVVVRVDPRNPEHLWAGDGVRGSTMGLWESHDGGLSWTKPASWASQPMFVDDVYDVAVDPANFDHLLVTSHSPWDWGDVAAGAGVMESVDGGKSWIAHENAGNWGQGHGIWFLDDASTWLLGTQDAGYWLTQDAGASWTQVTDVNMAHGGGQVYTTKDGVLYSSSQSGTLRSEDGGASWETVGIANFTTGIFGDGTLLYTAQGYAGAGEAFSTSPESDGKSWTPYNDQVFANGPDEMAFDSVNGILYSSNWGDGLLALKVTTP